MTTAPLVFLDTETTGLSLDDDIWEFAGIRREPDGTETELHLFIEHDRKKCARLPESFREDHLRRFPGHDQFETQARASYRISRFLEERQSGPVHVVGAVPNFDTERLEIMLRAQGHAREWHYHLIDVENLAIGYLLGHAAGFTTGAEGERREIPSRVVVPPWKSDDLSRALGVEPPGEGERHTALGDARWAMRLYDAIVGGAS